MSTSSQEKREGDSGDGGNPAPAERFFPNTTVRTINDMHVIEDHAHRKCSALGDGKRSFCSLPVDFSAPVLLCNMWLQIKIQFLRHTSHISGARRHRTPPPCAKSRGRWGTAAAEFARVLEAPPPQRLLFCTVCSQTQPQAPANAASSGVFLETHSIYQVVQPLITFIIKYSR